MKTSIVRSTVVLATVLVGLLVLPPPASATTFTNGGFAGLMYMAATDPANPLGPTTVPMVGPVTYGCPDPFIEVDVANPAGPSSAIDITDMYLQAPFYLSTGTTIPYVAVFTRVASTPGVSGTISPIDDIVVDVRVDIHYRATGTLCTPGGRACTYRMTFEFDGSHTAFPTTSSNSHVYLSASPTPVTVDPYRSCFSSLFQVYAYQRTAQITYMDFHVI